MLKQLGWILLVVLFNSFTLKFVNEICNPFKLNFFGRTSTIQLVYSHPLGSCFFTPKQNFYSCV